MTMSNDFLLDLFETDEQGLRGIFQNFGVGQNRTGAQQKIGTSLFQPVFNKFLGQITNELDTGGAPQTKFRDFVQDKGMFNFDRELLKSTDRSFSDAGVLGSGGTQFNFGQSQQRQGF
jgi:hypothetical protein